MNWSSQDPPRPNVPIDSISRFCQPWWPKKTGGNTASRSVTVIPRRRLLPGLFALGALVSLALVAGDGAGRSMTASVALPAGKIVFATSGNVPADSLGVATVRADGKRFRLLTRHPPSADVSIWCSVWTTRGGIVFQTDDSFTGRSAFWAVSPNGRRVPGGFGDAPSPSGTRFALVRGPVLFGAAAALNIGAAGGSGYDIVTRSGRRLRRVRFRSGAYTHFGPLWSPMEHYLATDIAVDETLDGQVHVARTDRTTRGRRVSPKRGDWFSVGWSPDERMLMIAELRAVQKRKTLRYYLIHPDGRAMRRVTMLERSSGAFDWSPDGRRLAFSGKHGGLFVAELGRRPRRFATTRGPASVDWSPRSDRILFQDARGVWATRVNGRGLRRLSAVRPSCSPTWSPDGRKATFVKDSVVFKLPAGGGNPRQLTHPLWDAEPSWSPDGGTIAFTRGPNGLRYSGQDDLRRIGVFTMSVNGGALHRLGRGDGPQWSPDGQKVAFVDIADAKPRGEVEVRTGHVMVASPAKSRGQRIAEGTTPTWSPDGKRLAYMRYTFARSRRGSIASWKLQLVDSAGGGEKTLLQGSAENIYFHPAWSPDGRTIAVDGEGNEGSGLTLIDVNTGSVQPLGDELYSDDFEWSPDGEWIAAASFDELWVIRRDGTAFKVLVRSEDRVFSSPTWSPDSGRLAFERCQETETRCDLYTIGRDGSGLARLTRTSGSDLDPDWAP